MAIATDSQRTLRVPRIFLDLRDIIEVCRVRRGISRQSESRHGEYTRISSVVARGLCTVLFNPAVYAEFAEASPATRPWEDVADFFITAPSVLEVESAHAYTIELMDEIRRLHPALSLPSAPVLRAPGQWCRETIGLLQHHPDWQDHGELKAHSRPRNEAIREWCDSMLRLSEREPSTLRARIDGWKYSVMTSRPYLSCVAKDDIAREAIVYWMKANGLDSILRSIAPDVDSEDVLARIDIRRCPSANAFIRAFWMYVRELGDRDPKDNDGDDWMQVPGIVHADFALIEKRLRHYLTAGSPELATRVFTKPGDLLVALDLPGCAGGIAMG